jgi:PiT family inorganic phosphate transporter
VKILALIIVLVSVALVFNFLNGFHDSSNIVATMISSRALPPRMALGITAVAEFLAPFIFGVAVAKTIGEDIVAPGTVSIEVIFAALFSAILWNIITWLVGIPSSSSHALIGGIIGAVGVGAGLKAIQMGGLEKVLIALFISPIIGLLAGYLFTNGYLAQFYIPTWVIALSASAISLGTAFGGWRLIKTLGGKFYKIRPVHGFSTQVTSASVILSAALLGGPVSTTQVVSSAIMGVGSAERLNKVRWGVAGNIALAWLLTIPSTALFAAGLYWLVLRAEPILMAMG